MILHKCFFRRVLFLYLFSMFFWVSAQNEKVDSQKLSSGIEAIMTEHKIPGVTIAVSNSEGVLWKTAIGYKNVEKKEKMTVSTQFRLMSVSKTFLSLAFLKLSESTGFKLSTPIRDVIPEFEFSNPWQDTHPVTVENLLEHTAGFSDPLANELINSSGNTDINLLDVLKRNKQSKRVRWRPGERFAYTSVGYTVAGYILEKLTGMSYEEYIKKNILKPLKMTQTSFRTENIDLLAKGYSANPETSEEFKYMYHRPATSLNSSVVDISKIIQLILNDGRIKNTQLFSEKSMKRFSTPRSNLAFENGLTTGYALGNYDYFFNNYVGLAHDGSGNGHQVFYLVSKELDLGLTLMINRDNDWVGFDKISNLVFSFFVKKKKALVSSGPKLTKEDLLPFTGYYKFKSPRNFTKNETEVDVSIKIVNDSLAVIPKGGSPKWLLPVDSNLFRKRSEGKATSVFFTYNDKMILMSSNPFGYYEKVKTNPKAENKSDNTEGFPLWYYLFVVLGIILAVSFRKKRK